jgi:Putative zinc-finger
MGSWKSAMGCDEIQESLSLYSDDGLETEARANCYRHLEVCPVCRARLAELRSLKRALAVLPRAKPPVDLVPAINQSLRAAGANGGKQYARTFGDLVSKWLEPVVARYAFSSVASIILFAAVFAALRPQMIALHEAAQALDRIAMAEPADLFAPAYDISKPISPESYAALRTPYNAESPSLNPRGSLALLAFPYEGRNTRQHDDDMVVVADVFSNGAASLADVMQAPRNRRLLDEFQKALRQDAAFVPAQLDRRPETMRVVFSVQRVDVHDRNY